MKNEQGLGTTRPIINRRTGEISGWKAILPREHSTVPPTAKNPKNYQQALPGLFPSQDEARTFLNNAIQMRLENQAIPAGADFSYYASIELASRLHDAKRDYGDNARARRHVKRLRSVIRCWFAKAPWYGWRPAIITRAELQNWFDKLRDEAVNEKGLPLSASYIQSIRTLTEAVFRRAGIEPNPAKDLRVPKSKTPKVPYLDVHAIRRFFSAESIDAADRLMVACGMGTGLRVGELLSLERADVHLDDHDPHIVIRYGGPDNSPPKGKRVRRVEVFEPALSAWRCWLRDFYRGGDLVFGGERGGYRAAWPEQFKAWAASAGQAKLTSHIMRHTYAVALLNGSWGYKPQPMEFVSRQLGHSSLKITERYYAAWENGSAARDVRIMTQREERPALPLTAAELFGIEVTSDASDPTIQPKKALATLKWVHGRQAPISHGTAENTPDSPRSDGSTHQDLEALARTVLEAARSGDPLFVTRAVELASRVLAAAPDSTRRAVG